MEVWGNNRSVMPLDVLGRTRATLMKATSFSPWPEGLGNLLKLHRAGDSPLQLLDFNEEFLVSVSHQLALITSLPFVHTARRYYRLNGLVSSLDCWALLETSVFIREGDQTWSFRGSKSRNKVSVGEPAEGSLTRINVPTPCTIMFTSLESIWNACNLTNVGNLDVGNLYKRNSFGSVAIIRCLNGSKHHETWNLQR